MDLTENSGLAPHRTTVRFVSAIAGAGKTHAVNTHMADRTTRRGQCIRYILAQTTTALVDQTFKDMATRFPDVRCRAHHGGNVAPGRRALREILETISEVRRAGGFVLIITHAAAALLPPFYRKGWNLIFDEAPPASQYGLVEPQGSTSRGVLSGLDVAAMGPKYAELSIAPKRLGFWQAIAAGKWEGKANTLDRWRALGKALTAPSNDLFVETKKWHDARSSDPPLQIPFYTLTSTRLIEGFASATVLGACLTDSLLYRIWSNKYHIDWQPHGPITKLLRATQHANGSLLTIFYATERDWSRRLRKSDNDPDGSVEKAYADAAIAKLAGRDFVYLTNTDTPDITNGLGRRLPNSPHGLNNTQHIDNVVIFSALNLNQLHVDFLNDLGVSEKEIKAAIYYSASYQAALRSSLRDPLSTKPKMVIVPDKGCADYLSALFPGCAVQKMVSDIRRTKPVKTGRPLGRAMTNADVVAVRRHRDALRLQQGLSLLDTASPYVMTVFDHVAAQHGVQWRWTGIDAFIDSLRDLHADTVRDKAKDNKLISPSLFDPKAAETYRGRANVVSACGIWLDNDGGVLTRQEFRSFFPNLRMVICNTHGTTHDVRKYRVFMPTTHAMGAELYRFVTRQIITRLEHAGYRSRNELIKWIIENQTNENNIPWKEHGFDDTKYNAENLFYLPCQAAAGPDASFFEDHPGEPIDIPNWMENRIATRADIAPEPEPDPAPPAPILAAVAKRSPALLALVNNLIKNSNAMANDAKQRQVAGAVAVWRQVGAGLGLGNKEFFNLAVKLRRAGMDWSEIDATLRSEAVYGSGERRGEVSHIMKSLKRSAKVRP